MLGSLRNRVPGVARLGRWAEESFTVHMKKHYILVHIHEPESSDHSKLSAYRGLLGTTLHPTRLQCASTSMIADNCWLLSREDELSILAQIVVASETIGLKTTVRFLCDDI